MELPGIVYPIIGAIVVIIVVTIRQRRQIERSFQEIDEKFPVQVWVGKLHRLNNREVDCPLCVKKPLYDPYNSENIIDIVEHLNDHHEASWSWIADWLESQGDVVIEKPKRNLR